MELPSQCELHRSDLRGSRSRPKDVSKKKGVADVRLGSLNETARAVGRLLRRHGNSHTVTGRIDLSDDRGVNNLGSDRSIP